MWRFQILDFSASNENLNIGVLDIDLCGPSAPRLFGVVNEQVHQSGSGWSPVYVEDNLALMSAGFLLPSEVIFRLVFHRIIYHLTLSEVVLNRSARTPPLTQTQRE